MEKSRDDRSMFRAFPGRGESQKSQNPKNPGLDIIAMQDLPDKIRSED
jgi:hypothetical protein